jgi:hypothetical protein
MKVLKQACDSLSSAWISSERRSSSSWIWHFCVIKIFKWLKPKLYHSSYLFYVLWWPTSCFIMRKLRKVGWLHTVVELLQYLFQIQEGNYDDFWFTLCDQR